MRSTRTSPRPHRRSRALALGIVAVLGAGLLAGCADDGESSPDTAEGGAEGTTTITVGTFGVFGYKQAGLYDDYMKLNPGITIKENVIERNTDYYPQLLNHLAAGSGLNDIQAVEVANITEVVELQAEKFEDVSKIEGVTKDNWLPWKWDQATNKDGKTIGLGTDIGPMALCYRKDLFEKAGLPTDREEVGKLWAGSWDKYLEVGKNYQKKAPADTTFMDSVAGVYTGVTSSTPERYYDTSGKLVYKDSPAVKSGWDLSMDAHEAKLSAGLKRFDKPWEQAFANGKFATVVCPSWMLGTIKEKAGTKNSGMWDVAKAPTAANWGGAFIGVPTAGKNKEEAKKLAAWLTAPEQQAKVFQESASFPSNQAAFELPSVGDAKHEYFNNAPIGQIFSDAAKDIPTLILGSKDQVIGDTIADIGILQVEQQGKTPDEGWDAAVKTIDNAIEQ